MSPGTPHSVFWLSNESGAILSQTFPFLWGGPVALSPTEEALYVFEQVNLERDLTKITPSGIAWRRKAFPSLPNLGVVAGDIRCEEDGSVLMLGIDPSPVPGSTYLINRARTDGTVLGPIAQLPFPFDEPEQTVSLLPRPGGDFVAQLHYEGLKKDVLTTFNSAGGLLNVTEFPFVSPSEGDPVSIGTIIGADSAGRIFLGLDPYLAWGGTWEQDRYFVNVDHSGAKLPCEPWVPYAPNHRITRRVSDDGRLLMRRRTGQNYFIELYSPAGVPHPDSYSLGEGGTLNVAAPGVKGNDGGASGMTVELVTPPTKGSLTLNPSGSFLYTSTGGWGADSFTYRLRNGAYVSRPGTVSINIIAVYPKALTTNKLQLVGGQQATITVKLDRPAALDGAVVNISSTRFTVPATVTVPYGALQVAFLATAIPQPAPAAGAIYAVRAGRMASISITVNPPALAALAVNPTTLKGGGTFLLYAGLNGTAPSSGIRVAITCDKPAIALVPNAIWVLFNASTQSAPVRTTRPTANTVCTITGSYNGVQKVTTVNVTP
jgi:hypothetical protein